MTKRVRPQPQTDGRITSMVIEEMIGILDAAVADGTLPPSAMQYGDEHHREVANILSNNLPEGCRVYVRKTTNGTRLHIELPADWTNVTPNE